MKIRFDGIENLQEKLKKNVTMNDVKKVVRHNGQDLTAKMVDKADFTKGYATGTTKRSIVLTLTDGSMTAEVEPKTEYSPYLEYGTRFMAAQPFVRPAFEEQARKFKADLEKLMR